MEGWWWGGGVTACVCGSDSGRQGGGGRQALCWKEAAATATCLHTPTCNYYCLCPSAFLSQGKREEMSINAQISIGERNPSINLRRRKGMEMGLEGEEMKEK